MTASVSHGSTVCGSNGGYQEALYMRPFLEGLQERFNAALGRVAQSKNAQKNSNTNTENSAIIKEAKHSRAIRGRSIELETMENNRFERLRQFGDNLPPKWYAFTGGYFYVCSNESFMDYTILNKVRITSEVLNRVEEIENDIERSAGSLDSMLDSFWSRKSGSRRNRRNATGDVANRKNDGLYEQESRSKSSRNSWDSSGDSKQQSGKLKKFSFAAPIEETKTLIARHNFTAEKMWKTLKLGG